MKGPLRVLTLACALCLFIAPAGRAIEMRNPLRDAPFWFWLMGYDRSPNAVRARFNDLMAAETDGQGLTADKATMSSDTEFEFRDERDGMELSTGATRLCVTGTLGADGAVSALALELAPVDGVGKAYVAQSGTAMKCAMYALFDDLSQHDTKQLALIYRYDLSPFKGNAVAPQKRDAQAVIKGLCIALNTDADESGAVRMGISFLGLATPEQMKRARRNNACNLKLRQIESECVDLMECAQVLEELLRSESPDREEALAVLDQMDEILEALREMKLYKYRKTQNYARQLGDYAEQASQSAQATRKALEDGAAGAAASSKALKALAKKIQGLSLQL